MINDHARERANERYGERLAADLDDFTRWADDPDDHRVVFLKVRNNGLAVWKVAVYHRRRWALAVYHVYKKKFLTFLPEGNVGAVEGEALERIGKLLDKDVNGKDVIARLSQRRKALKEEIRLRKRVKDAMPVDETRATYVAETELLVKKTNATAKAVALLKKRESTGFA